MKKTFHFSTTQIILFSFLAAILTGSLLLWLPISQTAGQTVSYLDALFTATTATCVTGLVTLPTYSTWSLFGQIVILILIQIGGLGIITVISGFMIAFRRKMGLSDRLLLQDAFNLNTLSGLIRFVKKVLVGTLFVEILGALFYSPVFVADFGLRGIWISVFTSVSAFCNAGIDIIGPDSLCRYATNPVVNTVTCALIVLGGIGYVVWWDVARVMRTNNRRKFQMLSLHSKIAITASMSLILFGFICILCFEWNNPNTLQPYGWFDRCQMALFQSVTTRTAGFFTIPQEHLTNGSFFVSLFLMFIGGSPVGTAGGIKTVTLAIVIISAIATINNKTDVVWFHRTIAPYALRKAVAVICTFSLIVMLSTLLLSATGQGSALDIIYETVSATATVGLSRNFTASLSDFGKWIIICTMYLGRIGPISLAFALQFKKR
ncbi:MAG: potassium transporter KtrB, partial [Clostridia bacterium]|nr:potassium transporter KtrB [Clostridia bacterium]